MSGRKFLSANILVDLMELEFKNDIVINLHRSMEVLIALAITAETFHVARILYACVSDFEEIEENGISTCTSTLFMFTKCPREPVITKQNLMKSMKICIRLFYFVY